MDDVSFEELLQEFDSNTIEIKTYIPKIAFIEGRKTRINQKLIYSINIATGELSIIKGSNWDVLENIEKNHFLKEIKIRTITLSRKLKKEQQFLQTYTNMSKEQTKVNNSLKEKIEDLSIRDVKNYLHSKLTKVRKSLTSKLNQ